MNVDQYREVRFASFLSDGFNTATVVNPLVAASTAAVWCNDAQKTRSSHYWSCPCVFSKLWILYMTYSPVVGSGEIFEPILVKVLKYKKWLRCPSIPSSVRNG